MTLSVPKRSVKCRSVFISDVHLGFRGSSANYLLDFLKSIDTEQLYLVGDIVDVWSLKKSFFWPQEHNNVLRLILSMAKRGTKVVYIPGNHDEMFREYVGHEFGNLEIRLEAVHATADGRNLLVLHGDQFDGVIKCASLLGYVGHYAYEAILWLNRHFNRARRKLGMPYWSLAAYLKQKAGTAMTYIDAFERAVAHEAKRRDVDGIVCGHIHRPKIADVQGVQYLNCGDWVESCTALTEDSEGRFSLLHWSEIPEVVGGSRTIEFTRTPELTRAA